MSAPRTVFGRDLGTLCRERGWSHRRLCRELRQVAAQRGENLPTDDCLKVMVSRWRNGRTGLSQFYAGLLSEVFECQVLPGKPVAVTLDAEALDAQMQRLTAELATLSQRIAEAAAAGSLATGTAR